MRAKYERGLTRSVDPDQTAHRRSSLIWVWTVCNDLTIPILEVLTVVPCFHLNVTVQERTGVGRRMDFIKQHVDDLFLGNLNCHGDDAKRVVYFRTPPLNCAARL